jgi:ubiquinone/menaquinone biosynthesis C-methylase UbiE
MKDYPRRESVEVVREFLPLDGARVVDVGCGDGSLVRLMAREGAEATGLEISESQLARARAASPVGGESYQVGRAEALPFRDKAFDIVVFFNSLHHVPVDSQEKALAEAARVLGTGGRLFVMEPLAEGPLFMLMRPVHDETEVRAAAYGALRRAAEGPAFEEIREYSFAADYCYESFEAYKDAFLQVDQTRRATFEMHEPRLRKDFERTARRVEDGYSFIHANRLNLLKRL